MLWAQANDEVEKAKGFSDYWPYAVAGLAVLVVLFVLLRMMRGEKKHPDLERAQRDDLSAYPPAPAPGTKRLTVNGIPVRLRLVVISPTGKAHDPIHADDVPELLDDILRGLGGFVQSDKPRIKIWPTQLSVAGFAPTFHRLVASPDEGKKSSRWIKLAGPARTGKRPILLGLALYADESNKMGDVNVEITEWAELLQVGR